MSFRELTMVDVKEVLRRLQAGQSARRIGREAGMDRKTAKRYRTAAEAVGVVPGVELTDEIVGQVGALVQAREAPPPSEARRVLEAQRAKIEAWLQSEPPLRLVRVHELLKRDGVEVGYTTLRRFVHAELAWRERPATIRLDDPPPGEEAQVDFGLMGYHAESSGQRRKLWCLIVTLSYSRYSFVWPTFTQSTEDVSAGLDAAWAFFGGVPKRVVFDNMKSVVDRAHNQAPTVNRAFQEYAQSRGFFVDLARIRKPQDKARVENHVPYVRERWFAGETFLDLEDARRSAARWSQEIAGARVHGTTRRVPREVYENEEREVMLPAPTAAFDLPRFVHPKVHPDHHVQVAKALYSVPTAYIGRTLDVRVDRKTVKMYHGTELIKVHGRVAAGKRSTDPDDFPKQKAAYAFRSIDAMRARATGHGPEVARFVERLLEGPLPWMKMRQAYGLMRLCERYGADRVGALCARSLAFEVVDVTRIDRMLKRAHHLEEAAIETGRVLPLPGRFARDPSSFSTKPGSAEGGES